MDTEYTALSFGFWSQGSGLRAGDRAQGWGFGIQSLELRNFWVQSLGLRILDSRLRAWHVGFTT